MTDVTDGEGTEKCDIDIYSANIYLIKVNNRNTKRYWEICSMFKVNNKNTRKTSLTWFWCLKAFS